MAPRIASFAALATRNFTTFLALIWMVSPVAVDEKAPEAGRFAGGACRSGEADKVGIDPADHFEPRIASLAALATRNFTTFLAGILISAPVAGLRPTRALRLTRTSLPTPGKVKVFLAFL